MARRRYSYQLRRTIRNVICHWSSAKTPPLMFPPALLHMINSEKGCFGLRFIWIEDLDLARELQYFVKIHKNHKGMTNLEIISSTTGSV